MENDIDKAMAAFNEMTKSQIIVELQKLGVNINPGVKREAMLEKLKEAAQKGAVILSGPPDETSATVVQTPNPPQGVPSATQQILDAIGGIAKNVQDIDKRLTKIETGDANAFKEAAKKEDIESASGTKSNLDPKIVSIIEKTLGVDFGLVIEGYDDKPGSMLTILVPQRLSPVATSFRPVIDKDSPNGAYKVGTDGRVVEEEYWPGDRRSIALGSNASYEAIQNHANRVRSYIMMTYQKSNRPQPDFKVKQ